ncbi:hypothetical protein FAY22_19280 [Noviherbaspirillum sp. UKPF54]|nr:hypothetical protein FAY22_19280 [Noviherbaspirillum sp. UKPF54]
MGMVKQDDGWRLPERLRVQMEPFLPPRKPHPQAAKTYAYIWRQTRLMTYDESDAINSQIAHKGRGLT